MATDPIALLTEDHQRLRALLDALSRTAESDLRQREQLLTRIEREMLIHKEIEEQLFYPALRAAGGTEGMRLFYEAVEGHRTVDQLILPDLKNADAGHERFSGRAKVLKDLIEHHAEEEESRMFALARQVFSADELDDLGAQMEQRRRELSI